MTYTTLETSLDGAVASIRLNRAELRNAMNAQMIAELTDAVARAVDEPRARVILLAGNGTAFCAGADLNWMREAAAYSAADNEADALKLARLLRSIAESPKPTLARVHGPAYAGGLGLVSACDIAVASQQASFCVSEVRVGLIPANIGPYLVRAIGARAASRYFLTAEVFDAAEAQRLGLVHRAVAADSLDATVDATVEALLRGGPQALDDTKRLIRDVATRPIDDALAQETARRMAAMRARDEGREGVASFLDKRRPSWWPQR